MYDMKMNKDGSHTLLACGKEVTKLERTDNDSFILHAGSFNTENANGRIYNGIEHIDGGEIAVSIIKTSLEHPAPSTKIVEDKLEFEHVSNGPNLDGLTMKNEYSFGTFKPVCPPHDQEFIDSVPFGAEIEEIRVNYRPLYNYHAQNLDRLIKLGEAYSKYKKDMKYIEESQFEQIPNPFGFPDLTNVYIGSEFMTMQEAHESGIVVGGSHPHLWRCNRKMKAIMFLDYTYVMDRQVEITGVELKKSSCKPRILIASDPSTESTGKLVKTLIDTTDMEFLWASDIHHGTEISRFDVLKGRPQNASGKTQKFITTGTALGTFSDMEGFGRTFREEPKEVVPTVRTNGRQQIVDNGKRQWPGVKTRKGHRRHG